MLQAGTSDGPNDSRALYKETRSGKRRKMQLHSAIVLGERL